MCWRVTMKISINELINEEQKLVLDVKCQSWSLEQQLWDITLAARSMYHHWMSKGTVQQELCSGTIIMTHNYYSKK